MVAVPLTQDAPGPATLVHIQTTTGGDGEPVNLSELARWGPARPSHTRRRWSLAPREALADTTCDPNDGILAVKDSGYRTES